MRYFPLDQHLRNNSDDVTEIVEHGLCQRGHDAHTGATIDDADPALAQKAAERASAFDIIGARARVRSAKNCQTANLAHARGVIAAITLMPNPASDWPPSHTTTAPVMNFAASLDRNSARSAISSL